MTTTGRKTGNLSEGHLNTLPRAMRENKGGGLWEGGKEGVRKLLSGSDWLGGWGWG